MSWSNGLFDNQGWYKAVTAAPPAGPTVATAFSFSGSGTSASPPFTNSTDFNFGTASSDRLVVIAVEVQGGSGVNATGVIVNSVSLTDSGVSESGSVGAGWPTNLFYGLVTSGTGVLTVSMTFNGSVNFNTVSVQAWTLKGLTTDAPQSTVTNTTGNSISVSVTAGQILLAGAFANATGADFATGVPQPPDVISYDTATGLFPQAYWRAATTTTTTYTLLPLSGHSANIIAATFQ